MAEYVNVEKPFLEKLKECHWKVIDQGTGIPTDPHASMRSSFDEVALKEEFIESVGNINPWTTREQLEWCYDRILYSHRNESLTEINKKVFTYLRKGIQVDKNEQTGELNPTIKLVDFGKRDENGNWVSKNSFVAINQFKVNTVGMAKNCIIPDIVCFVNGLPWIIVECKDFDVAEPLSDAYEQIRRYSNQRKDDDYFADDEGKEQLFYTNLFNVITFGTEARFGSISAEYDYFYNWADIFPEIYKTPELREMIETKEDIAQNIKPGAIRQEVIIGGMFNHEILIDVLRNFTIYMNAGSKEIKVICRYQQYRAVGKMIDRLRKGSDWKERSGVIWHTQGSGKSLTMVFLVKKMRSEFDLKDFKILMVVDRLDLENQLSETADLTDERVNQVNDKQYLVTLKTDTPNLNLVMIHKFADNYDETQDILFKKGIVPKFEPLGELNNSEKILILIDEAHRSQNGDMNNNLFMAFPNATRFGFTGTPLLTPRHKITTAERFCDAPGKFIDTYKMNDAVRDRATVDVKYIGMSTSDEITDKEAFDCEYEETFKQHTEKERQEIQKRYGDMIAYLASEDRVKEIANKMMEHYVSDVLPNGFKAMVVVSSILAAVRYKVYIERELIPQYLAKEEEKPEGERDEDLLAKLRILKVRAVVSSCGNNEPEYITKARKEGAGKAVTDAFKKDFNTEDESTGIGILCVCDRLLTGFDAPIVQVLYMDKNLREHDLLQAIARVNRTKKGKTHGLVVDYFGITKNLTRALGIYTDVEKKEAEQDLLEFGEYFKDIQKEIPELEIRYNKIVQLFENNGITNIQDFLNQKIKDTKEDMEVVEKAIEFAADMKFRAEFDTYIKNYFDRLDLLFNEIEVQKNHWIRAKRLGYLLIRIRIHYKDETLDLKWASPKVRKLIDKYVRNLNIEERVSEISILSAEFPKEISKYTKSKSQASAMEHAIRHHIKVNLENKDPALYSRFKDRLESIIQRYQGNWDQMLVELKELQKLIAEGRKGDARFKSIQMPFYESLKMSLSGGFSEDVDAKLVKATRAICRDIANDISIAYFWNKPDEIEALKGKIVGHLRFSGIPELKENYQEISNKIMMLAKYNYSEVLKHKDEMAQ